MRHGQRVHAAAIAKWLARSLTLACALTVGLPASAQTEPPRTLEQLIAAVVKIKTHIAPDGRTVQGLGREREGTGIVIDNDGLILTIGYVMVEAYAAEIRTNDGRTIAANVVGYDHDSGLGLLRASQPLHIPPLALGKAADVKENEVAVVASGGGPNMVLKVSVASKRVFAGNWEYLLDEAIFTMPAHPAWSGAALIDREGKVVGIGSLIVGDAKGDGGGTSGNMFVPADRLMPILGDLLADGHASGPARPWLGLNADEVHGQLMISRVTPGGPAEKAGLQRGDVIMSVSGAETKTLVDFYRKVWAKGPAGTPVPLNVARGQQMRNVDVHSINRLDLLKLKSTF